MELWRQSRGNYGSMEAKSMEIWGYGGKVEENMGLWRQSPGEKKYGALEAK